MDKKERIKDLDRKIDEIDGLIKAANVFIIGSLVGLVICGIALIFCI